MSDIYSGMQQLSTVRAQRGIVLIVGLVMVLLITIVGLAAVRGSGLQESMAGNMRDRNLSFQCAESALRSGEAVVAPEVKVLPAFDCTKGLCLDLEAIPKNSVRYWDSEWEKIAAETSLDLKSIAKKPRMLVEELDANVGSCAANEGSGVGLGSLTMSGDCIPYRITALCLGASQESKVIVQSAYKRFQQ
ncbi:MAG: PilX N-terminal domain-containing pilus assembly protein [Cellvibrio sp.]|uniref:pilus assembly PilX family protein n=1 Tax=Cellvibrio sp. TaxID=1965322 RepID=UPI0031A4646A